MENPFEEKIEELGVYRWITVDDCSEKLGVSRRTIFQYIKDGNFKSTKWKNRRIIDSVSVIGFLLKKRVIEFNSVKNNEIRKEIEIEKFTNIGNELFR
jgi:predicted site-specific integrase-resolvase